MKDIDREPHDAAFLQPTRFIDSDHPDVIAFAREQTDGASDDVERVVRLFHAVRDGVRYDPYTWRITPECYRASTTLARRVAFCIPKAILFAAAARVVGIPSRLAFADVRNHLATRKLLALLRTDEFIFHGYTELFVEGCWVKATPTFNLSLCEKFGVHALEFDGRNDALLHPFDREGQRHMEYLRQRGSYADLPFDEMIRACRESYPHLFDADGNLRPPMHVDFEAEAAQENG